MSNDDKKIRKDRPWSPFTTMLVEDAKVAEQFGEENLGRRKVTFRCVVDRENKDEPIHCTGMVPEDEKPDEYNEWMRSEWVRRNWKHHTLHRPTRDECLALLRSRAIRHALPAPILPGDEDDEENDDR